MSEEQTGEDLSWATVEDLFMELSRRPNLVFVARILGYRNDTLNYDIFSWSTKLTKAEAMRMFAAACEALDDE